MNAKTFTGTYVVGFGLVSSAPPKPDQITLSGEIRKAIERIRGTNEDALITVNATTMLLIMDEWDAAKAKLGGWDEGDGWRSE